MNMDEKIIGQRVKIFLKNRYCYTGTIISASEKEIVLCDKFDKTLFINRTEISIVETE